MPQVIDRLVALRVADVMARGVLVASKNQTMGDVAKSLNEHNLSSAPVVDELGHCVGVITASDFVKRESQLLAGTADALGQVEIECADTNQPYRCLPVGEDYVSTHMTHSVQSIDPDASLLRAARVMCAEHIHRLYVIDDMNHPVGVISTMDIVAAMVNVVEEMDLEQGREHS